MMKNLMQNVTWVGKTTRRATLSCRAKLSRRVARDSGKLLEWIGRAKQSAVPRELQNYAKGLEQEWSSIKPAMDLPWNNARAEGHVNRIKMIKKSMYGRGNIDVLRISVFALGP